MNVRKKRLNIQIIAAMTALILNSCVILPLYSNLSADIFSSKALLIVTDIVSALLDLIWISLLFSVTVCGTYVSSGKKICCRYLLISCAVIVIKHAADILVSAINFGFASVGPMDFLGVSLSAVFYIIILCAAYFAERGRLITFFGESEKLSKAYMKAYGTEYNPSVSVYPFRKFITDSNVLLYGILYGTAAYLLIKIGTRIYYDISFGAPESFGEVAEMVISYTSDAVESLLIYTCAFFLMSFILRQTSAKDNQN